MSDKVSFGAASVSDAVMAQVDAFTLSGIDSRRGWVRLGGLVGDRPRGVTLAMFADALAEKCIATARPVPAGLSAGHLSKAEKVSRVLGPLGVVDSLDALGFFIQDLYKMACAVEDGIVATLEEAIAWARSGGKLERKRAPKGGAGGEESGEPASGEPMPVPPVATLTDEEREALDLMRQGAATAGMTLAEFTRKAVAAALAA
jgi:hypothetical protein